MHFNPPTVKNSSNPFYHPLNEMKFIEEAVTVEMEFKTDADGAAVVGSETKSRGMLISGQKVKNKVYRLTFKDNKMMNQFMKTYDNRLNEGTEELEESTPAYRKMMKRYKGSDMEKVFKILDKEGYRMGEQSDTLVRNMLKKHKGNVKKAADQIMKDNPGMFDVNRMMMDDVQLDEKVMTFTFRKTEDAREFERKASSLANATDIMMMPGGKKTGVEVSTMGPKDDKSLISLAKKMGGRVHKIVEDVQLDESSRRRLTAIRMSVRDTLEKANIPFDIHELKKEIRVPQKFFTKAKNELDKTFGGNLEHKTGFKVSGTMKEDVEQVDEMSAKQHYNKMVAQGKVGRGGRLVTPIDRKRFPNREKEGLEGPFRSRKSGQVYYYDKKAGKYYDPLSDMFLQVKDVMETRVIDNLNDYLAEGTD
jgi:hypothetical protein